MTKELKPRIVVIGVGGAGGNAVDNGVDRPKGGGGLDRDSGLLPVEYSYGLPNTGGGGGADPNTTDNDEDIASNGGSGIIIVAFDDPASSGFHDEVGQPIFLLFLKTDFILTHCG